SDILCPYTSPRASDAAPEHVTRPPGGATRGTRMRGYGFFTSVVTVIAWLTSACSEGDPLEPGILSFTVGQEADTWTADPAPVEVAVDQILVDETRRPYRTLTAPADSVEFPDMGVAAYEVRGNDAQGVTQVFGRSLLIDAGGFAGSSLSLFVG